jgi:hypothetical protein
MTARGGRGLTGTCTLDISSLEIQFNILQTSGFAQHPLPNMPTRPRQRRRSESASDRRGNIPDRPPSQRRRGRPQQQHQDSVASMANKAGLLLAAGLFLVRISFLLCLFMLLASNGVGSTIPVREAALSAGNLCMCTCEHLAGTVEGVRGVVSYSMHALDRRSDWQRYDHCMHHFPRCFLICHTRRSLGMLLSTLDRCCTQLRPHHHRLPPIRALWLQTQSRTATLQMRRSARLSRSGSG